MDVDTTTVDITQGGDPQRFLFGGDAETRNFVGAALTSGTGVASGAFDPQTVAVQTRAPGSGSFIETVVSLERGRLQLSFSQFSSGAPIVGVALIDTKTGGVTSQDGPVRALGVQTDAQTQERARELSEIAVRNCLIQMAL